MDWITNTRILLSFVFFLLWRRGEWQSGEGGRWRGEKGKEVAGKVKGCVYVREMCVYYKNDEKGEEGGDEE